jgi:hypothetical protein
MPSTDVQIGVAALLELCAQRRAGVISAPYQEDPVQFARMLQAEAAGRELMAALVRSDPYPDISLGAVIRRLVGYIQTILTASTPAEEITPLLTVRTHYVTVGADAARLLRDAAILLVLAALDDGAQEVAVRLDGTSAEACLIVESDRPGMMADLPSLVSLRATVAAGGGTWNTACATHGASWLVHVTIPVAGLLQESLDKEHVNGY